MKRTLVNIKFQTRPQLYSRILTKKLNGYAILSFYIYFYCWPKTAITNIYFQLFMVFTLYIFVWLLADIRHSDKITLEVITFNVQLAITSYCFKSVTNLYIRHILIWLWHGPRFPKGFKNYSSLSLYSFTFLYLFSSSLGGRKKPLNLSLSIFLCLLASLPLPLPHFPLPHFPLT